MRRLIQEYPTWSQRKLAEETKRSVSWVKKWRHRLAEAAPDDREGLKSHSRRPNQAKSCGNRPPRLAFPDLPALPRVPAMVDPDRWLETVDGQLFTRRVNPAGTVQVDKRKYYIGRAYQGRTVVLQVDAAHKQFKVELANPPLKTLPMKGLEHGLMPFDDYLEFICKQAVSAWRIYLRKQRQYVSLAV